ncbi:DUF2929 family protein [Virgibacillus oceani]|uniref:DeoR faimly transcriptional regulator n=1 Tax=Virgibacillus oceani TaxID=1479511 RepID=A0A917HDB3_9BACI|nr:DUF2929 family protein [Virgibacillus oceani]GGG75648.1 hypothetical protein GCM10011398_20640 [Virgibacillus oceani]
MRFIWTLIWALLISGVISYVLTSMGGTDFDIMSTVTLAIIMAIAVYILGEGVVKQEKE